MLQVLLPIANSDFACGCFVLTGWFAAGDRWLTDDEMVRTHSESARLSETDELPGPPAVKLRRVEAENTSEALASPNSHVATTGDSETISQSPANEDDGWEDTGSWEDDEQPLLLLEDDSDDDSTFMRAQCNSLLIFLVPHTCLFVPHRFFSSWCRCER